MGDGDAPPSGFTFNVVFTPGVSPTTRESDSSRYIMNEDVPPNPPPVPNAVIKVCTVFTPLIANLL
jgi:hypothetical protein